MSQKYDWSVLHLHKEVKRVVGKGEFVTVYYDKFHLCDGGKQPDSAMPEKYLADESLLTRCEVCFANIPKPKKVKPKPIGDARKPLYLIDLWNKKRK